MSNRKKNRNSPANPKTQHSGGRMVSHHTSFAGPMPPAEMVAEYEKLLPGATNRFFLHAEKEIIHRHEIERMESEANIEISKYVAEKSVEQTSIQVKVESSVMVIGAYFGIISVFICLTAAIVFGFMGNNLMAGLFLASSVGPKIFNGIAVLLGKKGPSQERADEEMKEDKKELEKLPD